jgi:hypothetical protein
MKKAISLASIVCLWAAMITTTGCNGTTVAQDIVSWNPTIQSTAATVAAAVSILQPQDAILVAVALAGFKGAGDLCVAEANAYLANPGASTLQLLQAAVVAFEQQINASLLAAARIIDPKSQQIVVAALGAVGAAINAVLALIAGIKGNTLAAMGVKTQVKISQVKHLYNPSAVNMEIAAHYQISQQYAGIAVRDNTQMLMAMGF